MSAVATTNSMSAIESALIQGDLSKLNAEQRMNYYKSLCDSLGLNMLTRPFDYLVLNGKLVLYAKKDATDQLRSIKKISIFKLDFRETESTFEVIAYGRNAEGREDSDMGIVDITGLKGDKLANAKLKAVTKAKRRLTLSISGLGLLDETEVEAIPDARKVDENADLSVGAKVLEKADQKLREKHETQETGRLESAFYELENDLVTEALAHNPGEFVMPFGKAKGQRLRDLDVYWLDQYQRWLIDGAAKTGKPLLIQTQETVAFIEAFLQTREFKR